MNAKRVFYGLVVVILLLCGLIAGGAVFGNIVFQEQFEKLSHLKARSQALEQQSLSLIKAKQDIEKYDELDSIARQIVPQDKDQARTVREINRIALESGIRLSSITFETSTLGEKRQSSSSQGSETGNAGQDATSQSATSKALTQVKPVSGIPGVYSLGINIKIGEDSSIPYEQFLTFLEKLESNRRTAHVGRISITPQDGGANVTFSLTLNAFVRP